MACKASKDDRIIAAWAEPASGPGWANWPVYVLIDSPKGYRIECLQPEEQNIQLLTLYDTSAAVHKAMVDAVHAVQKEDHMKQRLLEAQKRKAT